MYPEYFADKPVERLLGKGIKAEHINDDALGHCMDHALLNRCFATLPNISSACW
jgi:hypothetical protein